MSSSRRQKRASVVTAFESMETSGKNIRDRVMMRVRIIIAFLQVVSSFGSTMSFTLPSLFLSWIGLLGVLDLNVMGIVSVDCLHATSHYDRTLVMCLLPAGVVLLLAVVHGVVSRRWRVTKPHRVGWLRDKCSQAALFLIFLIYPSVCTAIFRCLPCDELDNGERYLRADASIDCNGSNRIAWLSFVWIAILVYPIGVPVLFLFILWRARKRVNPPCKKDERLEDVIKKRDNDASIQHLSFLFGSYKPFAWWMECVELSRKVCLTGFVVLFTEGAVAQVAFALIVQLLSMWFVGYTQPFAEDTDNSVQNMAHWAMTLTLITFLVVIAGQESAAAGHAGNSLNTVGLSILLVGLIVAVLVLGLLSVLTGTLPDVKPLIGYVMTCDLLTHA
jgi:hypothetical protein